MLRLLAFCIAILIGPAWGHAQSQDTSDAYRLSPGDKVSLRVVVWNEDTRDYMIWQAVSGEYVVQDEGRIMVPLAGRVQAAGYTPEELADTVADALKRQIRSNTRPSTTIEVVEYGAFFIMGDVANPGAYAARPGLTALQAFALAGGRRQLSELGVDTLGILRDTGTLEQIQAELLRAKITAIRLKAEIEQQDTLQFSDAQLEQEGSEKLASLLEEERRIFASRKTALEREQASLTELISLLTTEIKALEKKIESQQEQLQLAEVQLKNTQSLVERGLARTPQLTQAKRDVFDLEAKILDLQNSFFRASQSIKEAERDILTLVANRTTQAAVELQNVNARIEALRSRKDTIRRLLLERGAAGVAGDGQQYDSLFRIQRGRGEKRQVLEGADTIVIPGDVLVVEQVLREPDTAPPG